MSFMPRSLYPQEGAAGTHRIAGLVGSKDGIILWGRDRSVFHIGNRTAITRFTVRSIVTILTELSTLLKMKGILCGNCSGCRRVWGAEGKFCSKSEMKKIHEILYIFAPLHGN